MLVFSGVTDVAAWLKPWPQNVAAAVALRSALRVIPALETGEKLWMRSPANERDIIHVAFGFAAAAFSHLSLPTARARGSASAIRRLRSYSAPLNLYVEQSEILFTVKDYDFVASAQATLACRLAADAIFKSKANASSAATGAIDAATSAAAHACSGFRSMPAEAKHILLACADDAKFVESGRSARELLLQPLWTTSKPAWADASWERLKRYMLSQSPGLDGWIEWYEQRLVGSAIDFETGFPTSDVQPPLNPQTRGVAEGGAPFPTPDLAMRPAMIEPVWNGDRLTLGDDKSFFDLGDEAFRDLLSVLHDALSSLATNLAKDSNCNPRTIAALDEMAGWTAAAEPNLRLVFKLGHAKDTLEEGVATTTAEWPPIYAAQYRAILRLLDRLLSQCQRWRALNQPQFPITDQQASQGFILAACLAKAFEQEGAAVVDRSIPEALRYLSASPEDSPSSDAARRRARDSLESFSNCLKRLVGKLADNETQMAPKAQETAKNVGKSVARGVQEGAKNASGVDDDRLRRVVLRVLFALAEMARPALMNAGADYVRGFFAYLAGQHPQILGWLEYFKDLL